MNRPEFAAFVGELEATFRGGLPEDRERAIQEHFSRVPFGAARQAIRRLVLAGQMFVPTPGELVGALRRAAGDDRTFEAWLAGQTPEERDAALMATWRNRLGQGLAEVVELPERAG